LRNRGADFLRVLRHGYEWHGGKARWAGGHVRRDGGPVSEGASITEQLGVVHKLASQLSKNMRSHLF
jgi:hypothetical protein